MALTTISPPPGVMSNGTETQAAGRWAAANRVRFMGGAVMPIGGWAQRTAVALTYPRAMHTWQDLLGTRRIAVGSGSKLFHVSATNVATDITPASLVAGTVDATQNFGFGGGVFGEGLFGTTRSDPGAFGEAGVWSLDNFGQYLVACMASDGRALWWDLNTANDAVAIAGAPTGNASLVVTQEDFLMLLGAGGNPRKVQWADQQSLTVWTPTAANQAGDAIITSNGQLLQGLRVRGQTLLLTDVDAHVATYVGPPFVYSITGLSGSCSAVSRRCAVELNGVAYWMGAGGFFRYAGGDVESLPCEVGDYVFHGTNQSQQSKVWAVANAQHSEVWWFYPSEGSLEIDRYVAYSVLENHWTTGQLSRLCGVDRSVFRAPIYADAGGVLYNHETGYTFDGSMPWLESGPVRLGEGDNVMVVRDMVTDERTEGDVSITFKVRNYPNKPVTEFGPYNPSNPKSIRFSGRYVRVRIEAERLGDWRVGPLQVDVVPGSAR